MKYTDENFFRSIMLFLTEFLPLQKNSSEHTIKSYRESLNLYLDFMNEVKGVPTEKIGFHSLNYATVCEFLNWLQIERNCKNSTRNMRLAALRSFMNYTAKMDLTKNAARAELLKVPIKRTTDAKVVDFLSESALKTLLEQPDTRYKRGIRNLLYMTLLYDTAARNSEILNLRLRDIVENNGLYSVILHGKGRKTRATPLEDRTAAHLIHYLSLYHPLNERNSTDFLFYVVTKGFKQPMTEDCVGRFIKLYGQGARKINPEVPPSVHPHQLRHTRAMHWYSDGMPIQELQQILGHASEKTVRIYASADTEMKRAAIRKANSAPDSIPLSIPAYKNNDEMIRRLYGMK